ncbi:MAG TPA: fibronectin type III domain-containing protein, partial [Ramlibacter sp.]|nr:fibronectin type III domain-containing protein [Ramlibacter sp.]
GYLVDKQLPIEALPVDDDVLARRPATAAPVPVLQGPTLYNVYQWLAPDPMRLPTATAERPRWQLIPQGPINAAPLDAQQTTDLLQFERERCYVVRAVRGFGADLLEGPPSPTACVKPVDVYPPLPPAGLSAVAAEGTISLIWEASPSEDVSGYLVLRGDGANATLAPVTPSPVVETRFVDRDVMAGMRYVYAVVAVDSRIPLANTSEPSAQVEETAR